MNPVILLQGVTVFVIVFVCHVIVWRLLKPKAQIAFLLGLFVLVPFAGFAALLMLSSNRLDHALAFVLYLAMAGAYIQTYPAIYANAPSLFIVHLIGQSKSGLSLSALQEAMSRTGITSLDERMKDLVNDSLIAVAPDQSVTLTTAGKILVLFMTTLRQKILGLGEGEG